MIYTVVDVDGNAFISPGTGAANTVGMKLDGLVKVASNSSAWNSGSYFMIAESGR
ncbi:MAG: hypothetical protein Q7T32_07510 [Moraxellaceae bacterium]|nr:hypothetical protein [Moraxellaceae bacterium]